MKTYYVDEKMGSDHNPGLSAVAPFKTLEMARRRAKPGDCIVIMVR